MRMVDHAMIQRIRQISEELGIQPCYPLMIGFELRDPLGNILKQRNEPGHSWTRNGWNMLMAFFGDAGASGSSFGAGYLTARDIAGNITSDTTRCCEPGYNGDVDRGSFCNPAENSDYGMMVGTGTTAFNVNQYALVSPVSHGSSEGQLYYGVMAQSSRSYGESSKTWTARLTRTFHNYDIASIVISEVGLYWYGYLFSNSLGTYMMARDVLEDAETVAYGQTLTVYYDVSLDFGAID